MGTLIVFEGISGCGKSGNVRKVRSYLADKGYKTCVIEWNSNRTIRKIIKVMNSRKILTSGIYSFFQWMSFLIDYFFRIVPLLKKDYILVADRYVYTGLTRDSVNGAGGALGRLISRIARKPDLVFFHDVHPQICHERIKKRGKMLFHTNRLIMQSKLLKNRHLYYLVKLRREYLRLFNSQKAESKTNIIMVDEDVDAVKKYVEDFISGKREMREYV